MAAVKQAIDIIKKAIRVKKKLNALAKTKENASRFHLQPLFVVLSTIIVCH